jgi:hypothetical protein
MPLGPAATSAAQTGRTHDRTRPMLQKRQKVLARAPSARDPKLTSIGHFQYLTRYRANAQNSHLTFSDMSLPLKGFARIIKFAQDQICQGG